MSLLSSRPSTGSRMHSACRRRGCSRSMTRLRRRAKQRRNPGKGYSMNPTDLSSEPAIQTTEIGLDVSQGCREQSAAQPLLRSDCRGQILRHRVLADMEPAGLSTQDRRSLVRLSHEIMHEDAPISMALRELIAAYTSSLNRCEFCMKAHAAVAAHLYKDEALVWSVHSRSRASCSRKRTKRSFASRAR